MNYQPRLADNFDCEPYVEELREELYLAVTSQVEQDKDYVLQSDCIIGKLRTFNLGDAYLEKYVYSEDKSMSILKRNKAISDVLGTIEQKIELAQELCVPEKMFGDWFDDLYGEDPSTNATATEDIEDLQEEHCQRKHLVDTKFIDTKVYTITLNPENVDVANLNCEKLWTKATQEYSISLKDTFEVGLNQPSKKEVRCIMNTINGGKYAETLVKLWIFSEIRITEDQRAAERAAFITFATNLYANVLSCQKSE